MLRLIARGSLGSLALKITIVGLGFLNQLVVTRLMGAEQYGTYVFALTWLTVAGLLARLGTDGMLTRFTAAYVAQANWSRLRGLMRFGYRVVFLGSLAIGLAGFLVLTVLREGLGENSYATLTAALFLLPVYGLNAAGQSLLYGFRHPWLAQGSEVLLRILMMLVVGLVFWWQQEVTAPVGMQCGLLSSLIVLLLTSLWVRRAVPGVSREVPMETCGTEWFSVCLPLGVIALVQTLLNQGNLLLIGMLTPDSRSVAIYSAALKISELAAFGLQAASLNLAPLISGMHAMQQKDRLQRILTLVAYGTCGFTILVVAFLSMYGEAVLSLFGHGFTLAYQPMMILMAGQVVNALTGSVGILLSMTGHQKLLARMTFLGTVIVFLVSFVAIPLYGVNGAALANALGLSVVNIGNLVYVVTRLGLNPTVFRKPAIQDAPLTDS